MLYLIPFIYGVILSNVTCFFPFTSLLISVSAMVLFARTGLVIPKLFRLGIIAVISLTGFFYAKGLHVPGLYVPDIAGETIEFQGVTRSGGVAVDRESGLLSYAMDIKESRPKGLTKLRLFSNTVLNTESMYTVRALIPKDAGLANPGNDRSSFTGYAVEISEAGPAYTGMFEKARAKLNNYIRSGFSGESAGFLMSIVTGERGLITKEMNNAFNVTGLAHILSISGSHFGMLFFILFRLTDLLVRTLPYRTLARLTLYVTPSQLAALICIPAMTGYLCISDMSFPAVRSFIMIVMFLFGLLVQRRGAWLNTLFFAAAIIVLINPDSILDLSFQLSFIAVLCIGLVADRESGRTEGERRGSAEELKPGRTGNTETEKKGNSGYQKAGVFLSLLLNSFRSSILISLAATIGTAPLVAHYFHYFSVISPVTNLVITPLIGFVILPLALLSSVIFLFFGQFPLNPVIDKITILVLSLIRYIAGWGFTGLRIQSFPYILLIMFYAGLMIYLFLRDRNKKLVSFSVAFMPVVLYVSFGFFEHKGIHVTYLDVGEGDAAVVELPDKRTMVFDTGKNGFQVSEFLKYRGTGVIDAVVLSHGDGDHAGGLPYLENNFRVSGVWDNGRIVHESAFPAGLEHRALQRGDVIKGRGYEIDFIHPYKGFYTSGPRGEINNDSLVVRLATDRNSFLFTGDIEKEGEDDVSELGSILRSNVLKVAHHGGRSSASESFIASVSPQIAVISVGRKNSYGHPHPETLEMLQTVKIYRTDIDGAIGIREMPDGRLMVTTWKDFQLSKVHSLKDEILNVRRLFSVW